MDNLKIPRSTPEAQGIPSASIINFLNLIKESGIEFHHLTIIRHKKVIAQGSWSPYDINRPIMLHSLTKLFTNTAIGMAYEDGLLSLDDKVISFFRDELPEVINDNMARMSVLDLITMRSGHARGISGNEWRPIKTSWVAQFLKEPVVYPPGEVMRYTSATSYMLSAIVQKVTGITMHQYLLDRLFRPLGITGELWDLCPHGINSGGNGLTMKNEDVAKIGLLYLNGGTYEGKRYLSQQWVKEAMYDVPERHDRESSYGFHIIHEDGLFSSGGYFGQTLVLDSEKDMVFSFNAGLMDNAPNSLDKRIRRMLKKTILSEASDTACVEDEAASAKLYLALENLKMPTVQGVAHSIKESRYSGMYEAKENEDGIVSMSFEFGEEGCLFELMDARGTHKLLSGSGKWTVSDSSMTGSALHHQYQPDSSPVAAYGAWATPNIYIMQWVWLNMTFVDTIVCLFKENKVFFKRMVNVNIQALERPEVTAKHVTNHDCREKLLRMETQY